MRFRISLGVMVILVALVAQGGVAHAATLAVDSTGDAGDASPGDGVCATAGGECTLRAAIEEANATVGHARGLSHHRDSHGPQQQHIGVLPVRRGAATGGSTRTDVLGPGEHGRFDGRRPGLAPSACRPWSAAAVEDGAIGKGLALPRSGSAMARIGGSAGA
jgi:CSLREA domain-containing protein